MMQYRKLQLDARYAVSELLIVVAGVMIALAADGLLQERADRSVEREYLLGLAADLAADTAEISNTLRLAAERAALGHMVLRAMDSDTVLAPNDLATAVERVMYLRYPAYSRSTILDLMSTGNLRLLRDLQLKNELSRYYQRIDRMDQWTVEWRQVQMDLAYYLPGLLDLRMREALISSGAPTVGSYDYPKLPWAPALDVGEADAKVILQKLRGNPAVRSRIEGMIRIQGNLYSGLSDIKTEAESTLAAVEHAAR